MADAAAHPVWSSEDEAIKEEFRRLEASRDKWQRWHSRVDTEAERFQIALENIAALPASNVGDGPTIAASALELAQLTARRAEDPDATS